MAENRKIFRVEKLINQDGEGVFLSFFLKRSLPKWGSKKYAGGCWRSCSTRLTELDNRYYEDEFEFEADIPTNLSESAFDKATWGDYGR